MQKNIIYFSFVESRIHWNRTLHSPQQTPESMTHTALHPHPGVFKISGHHCQGHAQTLKGTQATSASLLLVWWRLSRTNPVNGHPSKRTTGFSQRGQSLYPFHKEERCPGLHGTGLAIFFPRLVDSSSGFCVQMATFKGLGMHNLYPFLNVST